jgi:hypothetical protein
MWHILIPSTLVVLLALLGARRGLQKFIDSAYEN